MKSTMRSVLLVTVLFLNACGQNAATPGTATADSRANYKQPTAQCRVSVKRYYVYKNVGALSAGYLGPAAKCGNEAFSAACNAATAGILSRKPGASIGKCYPVGN